MTDLGLAAQATAAGAAAAAAAESPPAAALVAAVAVLFSSQISQQYAAQCAPAVQAVSISSGGSGPRGHLGTLLQSALAS